MKTMRTILENVYLDIFNNYLSIEKYAEHNGITVEQAKILNALAKDVFNSEHPDY